jgi:hypothetical protein
VTSLSHGGPAHAFRRAGPYRPATGSTRHPVLRLQCQPEALVAPLILRERECDTRASRAERRVRDRIAAEFLDEREPRILGPPQIPPDCDSTR